MFKHLPRPKYDAPTQVTQPNGVRHYVTPRGKRYPSVTTVLQVKSRDGLAKWKKRVGEEEAQKIKKRAGKRGTRIHHYAEQTLLNEKVQPVLLDIEMYRDLLKHLKRINNIRLLETALYSDKLRLAGTTDCVAEFDGELAIIDFKSSLRKKKVEYVHGYAIQVTAYAIMYEELFGVPIKLGIVIIANDEEKPQVFKVKIEDWKEALYEVRDQYEKENGIGG